MLILTKHSGLPQYFYERPFIICSWIDIQVVQVYISEDCYKI